MKGMGILEKLSKTDCANIVQAVKLIFSDTISLFRLQAYFSSR